jgi:hypothetical protein
VALLGVSLAKQNRFAEAEPLLLTGFDGMERKKQTIPANSRAQLDRVRLVIIDLYKDTGRPEKAAEWLKKGPVPPSL